jgi:glycosyltransferase involved in cell wall biosynthesis
VSQIRVLVLGLRGFPLVQGGVERHCEALYAELAKLGVDVRVLTRRYYMSRYPHTSYAGVTLIRCWSPRIMGLETLLHSLLGVVYAAIWRPDILHIHALGSAFWVPLARLLGLRVIVTVHGRDYQRNKFGRFAKWILRCGEVFAARWAQGVICVAQHINAHMTFVHRRSCDVISNGITESQPSLSRELTDHFGLTPQKYFVMVSRIDRDKRQIALIDAFVRAQLSGWKLVFVGDADFSDDYTLAFQKAVAGTPNVVHVGFRSGDELLQLYQHAAVCVLPSLREGNPLCLLEAMSLGVPILASAIEANLELNLPPEHYFSPDDQASLVLGLQRLAQLAPMFDRIALRKHVLTAWAWQHVAQQTLLVYQRVLQQFDKKIVTSEVFNGEAR